MHKSGITGLLIILGGATVACADPDRPRPVAAPVAESPSPVPATSFTVVAAGDLLVHPPLTDQAAADARAMGRPGHDFTKVLAAVKPIVAAADLGVCHMETPLATQAGPFTGFPIFSVPPQLADAAADAGFDTCSTASNHALDTGEEGIARTLAGLDRVGIKHTGTARSREEAATPTIVDVRGARVAHLSYTFSFNGIPPPDGKPWTANLIDPRAILAEARRARQAGADVVLLSLQWGTEYQHEADDGQLGLAAELLGTPEIDLIIGHHVHVVQPFQRIGQKWVAYGLGNLTTRFPDGSPEDTQDAVVPRFTFSRAEDGHWAVTKVEVLPTWMEYYPQARVVDLPGALAGSGVSGKRRDAYQRAYQRIVHWVSALGARTAGLVVLGR
jgi:poly-gamma-glutamate synthesis protein (capsule biosynthesis protein)